MSVIAEISIFPVGRGVSVAGYVARAVEVIRDSGLSYELGPMGTCIEGEWDEVMEVVGRCHAALARDCERVYLTIKIDSRQGENGRLASKVKAVRDYLAGEGKA